LLNAKRLSDKDKGERLAYIYIALRPHAGCAINIAHRVSRVLAIREPINGLRFDFSLARPRQNAPSSESKARLNREICIGTHPSHVRLVSHLDPNLGKSLPPSPPGSEQSIRSPRILREQGDSQEMARCREARGVGDDFSPMPTRRVGSPLATDINEIK